MRWSTRSGAFIDVGRESSEIVALGSALFQPNPSSGPTGWSWLLVADRGDQDPKGRRRRMAQILTVAAFGAVVVLIVIGLVRILGS